MSPLRPATPTRHPDRWSAWTFSFLRTVVLGGGTAVTALVFAVTGQPWHTATQVAPTLVVCNLVCWWLLARRLRAEGRRLRDLVAPFRAADLGWGLVWSAVLYVSFVVGLLGLGALLVGGFDRIGELFVPATTFQPTPFLVGLLTVGAIAFPVTNAPLEELYYRGYAQEVLEDEGRPRDAIVVPSIGFALQHAFVATTLASIPAYWFAFLLWGWGAALIRRRQGRLWPLIVAHLVANLATTAAALVAAFGAR